MAETIVRTTCGFCSTGCGLEVILEEGAVKKVRPSADYPVNKGKVCPKGFNFLGPHAAPDRGVAPLLKQGGERVAVDWETALSTFASRFKDIQKRHGPASVAFLSTGQIPIEEMALLGSVAKFGMGIVHGDGNTRQCMASAAVAHKQSFGFDAPGWTYQDLEESELMIFVGANPVINHPILWNRVKANPHNPEIVVIDPRRTETALQATTHWAITPKSDLTLYYAMARLLIENGWIDRSYIEAHTSGFEALSQHVKDFDLASASRLSGIPEDEIRRLTEKIRGSRACSIYWTMGVNHSYEGTRTAQALINLCLLTGQIGRPGTGPNSITGQCNAMGSRIFSNTTGLLGGREFSKESDRAEVARILNIPIDRIPAQGSWPYHKILEGIDRGEIKGLWIIATNPAHSWIGKGDFRDRLAKLDFLVVQDMYHSTDTAVCADLYLPSTGSGEKTGVFINSERRLGLVRPVLTPPGQAKTDFDIFREVARVWGCGDLFGEWTDPEAAFGILKRLSRGRPCDISGIADYDFLENERGIQWPFPELAGNVSQTGIPEAGPPETSGPERRLFSDGRFFTPDGRAVFHHDPVKPLPENRDEAYPFWLLTGRGSVFQWHTLTRTDKVEFLRKNAPAAVYVEVHPSDARQLGIAEGRSVRVSSRRGTLLAQARIKDTVAQGQVFIPMHYFETNYLTLPVFDTYSFEPSYKLAAVRLEVS